MAVSRVDRNVVPGSEKALTGHAQALATKILRGLPQAVKAGVDVGSDFEDSRGVLHHLKILNQYLTLKYPMRHDDKRTLAKTLYEFVTTNPQASDAAVLACGTLTKIIKKKDIQGLKLAWRPLYDAVVSYLPGSRVVDCVEARAPAGDILKLVRYKLVALIQKARHYFPPTATKEIIKTLLPRVEPLNDNYYLYQFLLCLFLPTTAGREAVESWYPKLLEASKWSNDGTSVGQWFGLWGRLAKHNPGVISGAQLAEMYARYIQSINLGQGNPNKGSETPFPGHYKWLQGKSPNGLDKNMAKLIISTIHEPSSRSLFSSLCQLTSTYFHPSNTGRHLISLAQLLACLGKYYGKRVGREKRNEVKYEKKVYLDVKDTYMVDTVLPIAKSAMYSKSFHMVMAAQTFLRALGSIHPQEVLPSLLQQWIPGLKNVTSSHRTLSALSCLGWVGDSILNRKIYPQGCQSLEDMLWLALPGIDPVDLHKTGRTLMFYTLVFYTVPLFDARKFKGKESKQVTEYDDDAQRATMKFEEFCPQFLDRVLLVIQQQEGYSEKNAVDRGTLYVIQRCVRAFFSTLSKNLSSVCVKHVAKKITGSDFWKVSKYAGNVLSSIGLTNNTEGLGVLFPVLYSRLVEESQTKRVTPEKDGEDEEKPYEEGGRFYYKRDGVAGSEATHCLYLLSQLPKQSGEEVIKYLTQIRAVYGIFKDSKSAGNRKYATRLIRSVLRTLTRVYPKEYRGQDALKFSDPNWAHWQEWGGVEDKNKLDIEYHVPTEKEVKHAAELCQLVLTPAMAVLDSGNKGKSEDVNNALLEISAILRGANSILGEFEGALVNKTDEKSLPTPTQPLDLGFKLRIDSKSGKIAHRPAGAKEEAGWESLRGYLAAKLSSAVTRLTGGSEDTASARKKRKVDSNGSKSAAKKTTTASGNVKVLTTLAECLGSVLNLWLINKSKLDRAFREKDQSRKSRKDWWSTKTCSLRVLLLERAYYLHLLRDEYATRLSRRYTLTVHRAIQSLVTLVLNDFEKVRSAAQQGLHATVERYPESATFCLTTLLTTVRSRYSSKEEMIGALGMLSSREVLRAACTNFSNAQALLKGLFDGGCESHEEDKVQQATHPLFMTLIQMLRAPVSPTDASSNLSKAYVDDFTKATKYLTSLLSDSKKKMHWRYELVATALLLELTLTSGVLTVDIVMVFARALTSDIFALRQFAIHAFNALLSARHVYSIPDHPKPSETTATPGESKGEDPKDLKEIQDEKEWQSASLQEIFGG
ncbi:hypothetical protein AAMO2058_001290800 [Amorphochlora amoebiformis]